jgi:hypothetical protein
MDDATIARVEKLALDIQSRLGGRVRNLRLVIQDTGLVLLGQADTHHAKQLAQHAVTEEIDLPLRANQMVVNEIH